MALYVVRFASVCLISSLVYNVCGLNRPPEAFFYGLEKRIPENTTIGSIVFFVNASDPDGLESDLQVSLNSNIFNLLSNGSVELVERLNYESATAVDFRLRVSDGYSFTDYSKTVQISDVNDEKPRFSKDRYQANLAENTKVGKLVFNVTVNDIDVNNEVLKVVCVRNSPQRDACDKFRVKKTRATNKRWVGAVYLDGELDYETDQLYQLRLQAQDGENRKEQTFQIQVVDIPDSPPYFERSFSGIVNEDVPRGTFVLNVKAIDRDTKPRPIRYKLTKNPGDFFAIDAETGNITTAKILDRETQDRNDNGIVRLEVTAQELMKNGSLGDDISTKSTVNVTITIVDVNDNPPKFHQDSYAVNVSEAIENGQGLPGLIMSVSDADGGNNAFYKFVFKGLKEYQDIFEINPPYAQGSTTATLIVKNSSALDYDAGNREYTLEVVAEEQRTENALSSTAAVTIYLMDANDNKPKFDVKKKLIDDLSELTEPGEEIATLPRADDIDTGMFGKAGIRYTLIGPGNNRFELDKVSAVLRLANCTTPGRGNCLDHESRSQYNLNLVATDNDGTGHETLLPLVIKIKDENDNRPDFTSNIYQYKVTEETTQLSTDQQISATDRDSSRNGNNRIRYAIVTDRKSLFTINTTTGELKLKRPVQFSDGNANGRIRITIAAGNLLNSASKVDYTRNATVDIFVQDINNNAPRFPRNYSTQIQENIRPGIEIIRVKAEDEDFGQNAAIIYSIVDGDFDTFQIDRDKGIISRKLGADIDFDKIPQYNVTVRATDKGNPRLSGDTKVFITVIDDSNRNPFFSPTTKYANVSEDEDIDFLVVSMQAIDFDPDADLRYSFVDPTTAYDMTGEEVDVSNYNFKDLFRINPRSGEVRVNKKLDVTKVSKIIYRVLANDTSAVGQRQTGFGTLTIDIINANDHAPQFESADGPYSVYEEEPPSSLVMVLTASDADQDIVTYEIIRQSVPGALTVLPATGIVTVANPIDYESVQSIDITVRASDQGTPPRYTDKQFSIKVTNINDNVPIFKKRFYEGEIRENSTERQLVVTVRATDADLPPYGDVKYKLLDGETEFEINAESGAVFKKRGVLFDREMIKEIRLPVVAYDGPGTPSRSAVVPVYITIKDINDNSPYFIEKDVYIILSDDHPVGSFVTKQTAYDLDTDDSITYAIRNDPQGRYAVSSDGTVTTRKSLKSAPDHAFHVAAADRAGNIAYVRINVTMVGNKKGPEWIFPKFDGDKIVVCEDRPAGFTINEDKPISAVGADEYYFYINNQVTQSLGKSFGIIPRSGKIFTTNLLDRETQDKYLVQVIAKDADGLTSQRYLLIEVCDRDDNEPEFPSFPNGTAIDFNFYIEEDIIGCVRDPVNNNQCGRVTAYDLDLPPNSLTLYSLRGPDATDFMINELTGVISSRRGLDVDTKNFYRFQVSASNYRIENGQRIIRPSTSINSTAFVNIRVLPKSEIPSYLIRDTVNMYTSIDTQIGKCLDTMRPRGLPVGVTYTITSQNLYNGNQRMSEPDGKERFSIDRDNGYICTVKLFNPRNGGFNYRINVRADSPSGVESGTGHVWLTENIHKIRIVIDGPTTYVNSNKHKILEALKKIIGTDILWIDSVGQYVSKEGSADSTKSDVIIHAVDKTSRQLLVRNETTITEINRKINQVHKSTALSAKILRAEDTYKHYIYLNTGVRTERQVSTAGFFPAGLLAAMILLLPLLLLPFLLGCCLCCPCCAPLFAGGKKSKYAVVAAPAGYEQGTFIDDWYEQSKMYNNPAYVDYDENWETGSSHMLVTLTNGQTAGAGAGAAKGGSEVIEESEEYYKQMSNGMHGNMSANQKAALANGAAGLDTMKSGKMSAANYNTLKSSKAETAVIVDSLTPSNAAQAASTVVVEERIEKKTSEENHMNKQESMAPLASLDTSLVNQDSALSPSTIDMLDSASTLNAQVASNQNRGQFSHTAIVNRHGKQGVPSTEGYYTSGESYESDYHSDHRPPTSRDKYHEETGMTIILDAQPTRGMEVEDAEYEVVTDVMPTGTGRRGRREYEEYGASYRSGTSGTLPRNGFTIELEPHSRGRNGMVADREEYVLTDDDGLAPEFFAEAPRSPTSSRRRYRKTTTRTMRDKDIHGDYY